MTVQSRETYFVAVEIDFMDRDRRIAIILRKNQFGGLIVSVWKRLSDKHAAKNRKMDSGKQDTNFTAFLQIRAINL